jgi:hypothetical protein
VSVRVFSPRQLATAVVAVGLVFGVFGATFAGAAGPAKALEISAASASDEPYGDDYYIAILRERFGVYASDADLTHLLATPDWGAQIRVWVDMSIYGDTVLDPTRVGEQAQAEIVSQLFSSLGVRDFDMGDLGDGFASILDYTSRLGELSSIDGIALDPLSSDGQLASFNYAHNVGDLAELYSTVQSAVSFASSITGFFSDIRKYTQWGVEAITDRPWRQLLLAYQDDRQSGNGGAGMSIAQTQDDLLNGQFSFYYPDVIESMTRDLGGTPFADLFPLHSRFASESDMWQALESAYLQLQFSQDVSVQSAIGALIDLLVVEQQQNHVVAIQTANDAITVINAGPATLKNIRLKVNGSQFASASSIPPYAKVVLTDGPGNSLANSGEISFEPNGLAAVQLTFAQVRQRFYTTGVEVTGTGYSRMFTVKDLVMDSGSDLSWRWNFGDGATTTATTAVHDFTCAGSYDPQFTITGTGGQLLLLDHPVTISSGVTVDWTMSGSGYAVAPGVAAQFQATGPVDDETTRVDWSFGDGGVATGRDVSHTFGASTVREVVATVTDVSSGCAVATAKKWISVGSQTSWVQLPTSITDDVTLSGAVGGYWSSSTVTIKPSGKLFIPGGMDVRSGAATLFDVSGELRLDGAHLTSLAEGGPSGAPTVPDGFRFTAVTANVGSTVSLDGVTADKVSTLLAVTGRASVDVVDCVVNGASSGISATNFNRLSVRNSTFNGGGVGVALNGGGDADLTGNLFSGVTTGFSASGYSLARASNNTFTDVPTTALLTSRGMKSEITGSTIIGSGGIVTLWGSAGAGITRLHPGLPYFASAATVPAGSNIFFEPGVAVKVPGGLSSPIVGFSVAGRVTVRGTTAAPVIFTSSNDDSLGGDTDGAGTSSGDIYIPFGLRDNGVIDVDGAQSRGGQSFIAAVPGLPWPGGWGTGAGQDGTITVTNSELRLNSSIQVGTNGYTGGAGRVRIVNTDFPDGAVVTMQSAGGDSDLAIVDSDLRQSAISVTAISSVSISGTKIGSLAINAVPSPQIIGNVFYRSKSISLGNYAIGAVIRDNTSSDSQQPYASLWGSAPPGTTHLTADLPYSPSGLKVYVGSTLILDPGVQVKIAGDSSRPPVGFSVEGEFRVEGTAEEPVVFTSFSDDSVGGDSDGVDGDSLPFAAIGLSKEGTINVDHALVTQSLYFVAAVPGDAWAGGWGTGAGDGGTIAISHSDITAGTAVTTGVYNSSGAPAAIQLSDTVFRSGYALSMQGPGAATTVEIVRSDLRESPLSILSAAQVSIADSKISIVSAKVVPHLTIVNNELYGAKRIYLYGSSIGATVAGNAPADGSAAAVTLAGSLPAGTYHLNADLPYQAEGVTVESGATLILDAGVRVKTLGGSPNPRVGFSVSGTARVEGTAANPVIFTSAADDSVGGDTDGVDGAADPASTAFATFGVADAGVIEVDGADVLGGRAFVAAIANVGTWGAWVTNTKTGGVITIDNSDITSSTPVLVGGEVEANLARVEVHDSQLHGGLLSIRAGQETTFSLTDSDLSESGVQVLSAGQALISGNRIDKVDVRGTPDAAVTDNTFVGTNSLALNGRSIGALVAGNSSADGVAGIVALSGTAPQGTTHLSADLPYGAQGLAVNSGSTLVFDEGTRVKIPGGSQSTTIGFSVAGEVRLEGTSEHPVTVTSAADDTVGGDTDRSGPAAGAWNFAAFGLVGAGEVHANHARMLGGTYFVAAVPNGAWGAWTTGAGIGGIVDVHNSELTATRAIQVGVSGGSSARLSTVSLAESTIDGGGVFFLTDGNTALNVERNTFLGHGSAVVLNGPLGTTTIRENDFAEAAVGVSSSVSVSAKVNWWGSVTGPSSAPSASATVATSPWCLNVACTELSASLPTEIVVDGSSSVTAVAGDRVELSDFVLHGDDQNNIAVSTVLLTISGAARFDDGSTSQQVESTTDGHVVVPAILAATTVGSATVTAELDDLSTIVEIDVVAGEPFAIAPVGTVPAVLEHDTTTAPYVVLVSDSYGNPVAGASVEFAVDGSALLSSSTAVVTGADGKASSATVLVGATGTVGVRATAGALSCSFGVQDISPAPPLLTLTASPTPTIVGDIAVGSTVSASTGTWQPSPVQLQFHWFRGSTPIPGATSSSYELTIADIGHRISVEVTGSKSGYSTQSRSSAATIVVPRLRFTTSLSPIIIGEPTVGTELVADLGAWHSSTAEVSYRWYRDGRPITGAHARRYTVSTDDEGHHLSVKVVATRPGYIALSGRSPATDLVPPSTLSSLAPPTIMGVPSVHHVLTVDPGQWQPADITIRYQWYRGDVAIPGATSASYRLAMDDVGFRISVKVTGSKDGYQPVTTTSYATPLIR